MRALALPRGAAGTAWRAGRLAAAARAVAGVAGAICASLAGARATFADSPAPSQAVSGDPRAGQAAGFVGDPGQAILIVALIVVASLVVTLAWVRATGGRAESRDQGR